MAKRLTCKAVNDELLCAGHPDRLEKASCYFYSLGGKATDWIERTVRESKIGDLTLEQWAGEFRCLEKVNAEIMSMTKRNRASRLMTTVSEMLPR
jgi:hypothetical protein